MPETSFMLRTLLPDELYALLKPCYTNRNSCRGSGRVLSIQPNAKEGEIVLFFSIDDQSNSECQVRGLLGISGRICDCLILYVRNDQMLICLVELKGREGKDAEEQIVNTYNYLQPPFSNFLKKSKMFSQVKWRAFIYRQGGSNRRNEEETQRRMEKAFGRGNFLFRNNPDLGDALRAWTKV